MGVVIASNVPGLAGAVKDGQNGLLVEPENVEQWVDKITDIFAKGDNFRARFGKSD
jgi:glycosyltransferase involved in cell wall biosynthesis